MERIEKMHEYIPSNLNIVFEFRDISWFKPEVYEKFKKNELVCCRDLHPKTRWGQNGWELCQEDWSYRHEPQVLIICVFMVSVGTREV